MNSTENRDKILTRVANLIAKAESSDYGPERDAFREKADNLMLQHAIQQADLAKAGEAGSKIKIVKKSFNVAPPNSPFREALADLFWAVARHCRGRGITHGYQMAVKFPITGTVVGTEADVEYAEMLFNSLRLQMANEMEPKFDPNLSMEENVLQMRHAGLKWTRIESICGLGSWGGPKTYKKACAEAGIPERKNQNPKTIKRNFAEGFVRRVNLRFMELKRRQEETHDAGAALVPVTDAVTDAYEEFFPDSKPARPKQSGNIDPEAQSRGDAAGRRAHLGQPEAPGKRTLGS